MGEQTLQVYSFEDLQATEGVQPEVVKTCLRIDCFSGTFVRDRDFPIRFKNEALKLLAAHIESGFKSFIVESTLYLTVWKEEKSRESVSLPPLTTVDAESEVIDTATDETMQGLVDGTPPVPQPALRKTVTRKYRGQEYTVEVADETLSTDTSMPTSIVDELSTARQTSVKKYRGQEYTNGI